MEACVGACLSLALRLARLGLALDVLGARVGRV